MSSIGVCVLQLPLLIFLNYGVPAADLITCPSIKIIFTAVSVTMATGRAQIKMCSNYCL